MAHVGGYQGDSMCIPSTCQLQWLLILIFALLVIQYLWRGYKYRHHVRTYREMLELQRKNDLKDGKGIQVTLSAMPSNGKLAYRPATISRFDYRIIVICRTMPGNKAFGQFGQHDMFIDDDAIFLAAVPDGSTITISSYENKKNKEHAILPFYNGRTQRVRIRDSNQTATIDIKL